MERSGWWGFHTTEAYSSTGRTSTLAVRVYLWRATHDVPVDEGARPVGLGGDALDVSAPVEVSSKVQSKVLGTIATLSRVADQGCNSTQSVLVS